MFIKTSDLKSFEPFLANYRLPDKDSHKGQNGKVLIIGGSSLFHGAVIWAAEISSYFADMVHVASTKDNNEIINEIKKKWHNGIVVHQQELIHYAREDDVIFLGTGMMRSAIPNPKSQISSLIWEEILSVANEGERTYWLTKFLLETLPEKKWVIDAGSLQMMDRRWLMGLKTKPILTPHQKEFETLFGVNIMNYDMKDKIRIVEETAKEYRCVLLLKAVYDIVSDGDKTIVIEGGNAGLSKGGTGDIVAAMGACFYVKNNPVDSAVVASFIVKKTADELYAKKGYWYNNDDIISHIPAVLTRLLRQQKRIT